MQISRRNAFALAALPLGRAFAAPRINSKFGGVQVGAITYSFNRIASPDAQAIIRAYTEIGLGEAELMSNHCEALAGGPQMPMMRPAGPPGPNGMSHPHSRPFPSSARRIFSRAGFHGR